MKALLINKNIETIKMIKNGKKNYLFGNNKFESGMTVYAYEGLGKKIGNRIRLIDKDLIEYIDFEITYTGQPVYVSDVLVYEGTSDITYITLNKDNAATTKLTEKQLHKELIKYEGKYVIESIYEGSGKAVLKFTVGEIHKDLRFTDYIPINNYLKKKGKKIPETGEILGHTLYGSNGIVLSKNEAKEQGFENQKYTMEITNLVIIPKPYLISDFISYSKLEKFIKNSNKEKAKNNCMTLKELKEDYEDLTTDDFYDFLWKFDDEGVVEDILNSLRLKKAPRNYRYVLGFGG